MPRFEYDITALPTLPALGEAPPITPSELRDLLGHSAEVRQVLDGILLAHDVDLFLSIRSGQEIEETPFVLSRGQLSNEEPLPCFLIDEFHDEVSADELWGRYFRHVTSLGLTAGAHILLAWARFEVTLRNALAERRSRLAGHPFPPPLVAEELCAPLAFVAKQADAWANASDLLSAHRALMAIRRDWIDEHQPWYSFALDEIAAYALGWLVVYQAHKCRQDAPREASQ